MRNRLADGARRQMRRSAHELQVDVLPVTFSEEQENIGSGDYGDPEALRRAISELPPRQREAIELLKLRELSLKEASVTTGMSIAALKVSVHRAMVTLRKTLKKEP
jgi:RNA polymerase sigma-70 factor (ECF subfamily)